MLRLVALRAVVAVGSNVVVGEMILLRELQQMYVSDIFIVFIDNVLVSGVGGKINDLMVVRFSIVLVMQAGDAVLYLGMENVNRCQGRRYAVRRVVAVVGFAWVGIWRQRGDDWR